MTPEKKLRAAKVGLRNLGGRISAIRDELEPLVQAHLKLIQLKWDAEEKLIPVKIIPIGATKASVEKDEKALEKKLADMSKDEAEGLLKALEGRLK